MKKKFNLSAYKKLLKLYNDEGLSFMNKEYLKLLNYQGRVTDQITYNRRQDYFLVIHKYLARDITFNEFQSKFKEMQDQDSKKSNIILEDFQKLENFFLAENLDKFSRLMSDIDDLFFSYYEVWDGSIEPMSQAEFYHWINDLYLQLQEGFSVDEEPDI